MVPCVDINLFVHNGENTVAAAIDSVLAQTWPNWRLTLIDDGSTDGTPSILRQAASHPKIRLKRNRHNAGAVGAFQRGFWFGDADFVMPKSADDLIAPEFVERLMEILLAHPACVMAHAAGLSFNGPGLLDFIYPESHRLNATGPDPLDRAEAVMRHYTSSPSFWGIYRRDAVDRLAPIAYRPGWDHVLLAELALYGEIRHEPGVMYWRRGGGRPVRMLARAAAPETARGGDPEDWFADALWRFPYLGTAFAHIENFISCALPAQQRHALIARTADIFRARWGRLLNEEATQLAAYVLARAANAPPLAVLPLMRLVTAATVLAPSPDVSSAFAALSFHTMEPALC